jgi:hypothetical protein
LPANALGAFVRGLAQRIAQFPAVGMLAIKGRVGAITLGPIGSFRRAFDPSGEKARNPETQCRTQTATRRGPADPTRGDGIRHHPR